MLISERYKLLNAKMHKDYASYGTSVGAWAKQIKAVKEIFGASKVLDYGCGKGGLARTFPTWSVREYDPAIKGKDTPPASDEQFDLIVCTDVLEHVEPACLDDVLEHIAQLAPVAFFSIATVQAKKQLPDGRNAHLIVRSKEWWCDQLCGFWDTYPGEQKKKQFPAVCVRPDRDPLQLILKSVI